MNTKLLAGLILVLSLVLSFGFFIFRDYFRESQNLGLLGIFIINFISNASLFLSAPSFISIITGGTIYSPILVALVSSLGATLGDMVSYFIGISGRHLTHHKLKEKILFRVLDDLFKLHGGWITFILALIPNPFFDAIGLIAGVFAFSPLKFLIIVFIGRLIRFFILASLGAHFG